MKSKMSFFDPTLLKKNISRFAPAWGIFLVLLLLTVPLNALGNANKRYTELAISFLQDLADSGPFVAASSAIMFAALLFRYLHNTQAAYMMHAFPMTRTCLFLTNLTSGLLFFLVPVLVTFLANLGAFAVNRVSGCGSYHWAWLGKWTLEYLFFYGLAVFCMFLSGGQFISILSYAALNFVFLLIPLVSLEVIDMFFNGFDKRIPDWMTYLSPVVGMMNHSGVSFGLLALYAGVGVGLMGMAWLFYRQRHVERAGDAMVFSWAQHLFRLVFTFCVGLYFGMVFTSIYDEGFLLFTLIGLFLGWFGSTMLLERTVKVFKLKKAWLGYGIFAAVLLLSVGALKYDVLGWQRRVPETGEVMSVEITTSARYEWNGKTTIELTEPSDIDVVRDFHARAVEKWDDYDGKFSDNGFWNSYGRLRICYRLKNGTTLRRSYYVRDESEKLALLYASVTAATAWYEKNLPEKCDSVILECSFNNGNYNRELICEDYSAVRKAILADAAAGRLPVVNSLNYDLLFPADTERKDDGVEMTLVFRTRNAYYEMDETVFQLSVPETAAQTLALFGVSSLEDLKDREISADAEQSWFSDYEIRGNRVYLTCKLTLRNESGIYQHGRLWASFPKDVGTLMQEERLPGYLISEVGEELPTDQTPTSIIDLDFGENEIQVVFVGTYAGGTQKNDRCLPELYWYPYENPDEEIIIPIQ